MSDLHLGARQSQTTKIIDFLEKNDSEILILNGDIIDGWALKSGGKWKKDSSKVFRRFMKRSENGTKVIYIRGNHDDPKFFDGTYNWSNIKLLPDYTVTVIEGKRILFIGGATSIDRLQRIPERSWWEGEIFNLDVDKLSLYEAIDIVVTHTAPKFAYPIGFNHLVMSFAAYDPT